MTKTKKIGKDGKLHDYIQLSEEELAEMKKHAEEMKNSIWQKTRKTLNKVLAVALVSIALAGCSFDKSCSASSSSSFSCSFNQETYVWESFLFPTNRTSGAQ